MNHIDQIRDVLLETGFERYGDEGLVSQLQHALQCAALASKNKASPALITAALLHDIGHVIDKRFDGAAAAGIDRQHEVLGSVYLAKSFGPDVTEPVRLHLPAKRYLCAVDLGYIECLSPGSVRSLNLQGGSFNEFEAKDFENQPFANEAIQLRRWDDQAKDPNAETEPLDYYLVFASMSLNQ